MHVGDKYRGRSVEKCVGGCVGVLKVVKDAFLNTLPTKYSYLNGLL